MGLSLRDLTPHRLYALDTFAFIYFLERNPRFYSSAKVRWRPSTSWNGCCPGPMPFICKARKRILD